MVNLPSFYGLVAFVKTVVSCTRNTNSEGLEGHMGEEILGAFLENVLQWLSGQVSFAEILPKLIRTCLGCFVQVTNKGLGVFSN